MRGPFQFIPSAPQQPITGHDPADDRPVFFNGAAAVFGTSRMHGAGAGAKGTEMIQRAAIKVNGSGQEAGMAAFFRMKMAAPAKHNDSGRHKKYAEFMGKLHNPFFTKPSVLTD